VPRFVPEDLLVVVALPLETQGLFVGSVPSEVIYTGVGKVNAAYHLTRALTERRLLGRPPRWVVNFGTAGSPVLPTGTVLVCNRFVQRDMDVTGLGFALGHTPFEEVPAELVFPAPPWNATLPIGRCASADRFEQLGPTLPYEAIDMEGYALAKVCWLEGLSFASVKFISDGADHQAAADWHDSLPAAAQRFLAVYRDLIAL
jgi:adenosylhomocysteine nucleosidase